MGFDRNRRGAILWLSAAWAGVALGCGGDSPSSPTAVTQATATTATTATGGTGTASATCAVTPSETVGPYPSLQDLIRRDIREDREGTPLHLTIAVVSQIAFPEDISNLVHTQGAYASRGIDSTTNARDGIFSDGVAAQLASVSGSPVAGMSASWRIGVQA